MSFWRGVQLFGMGKTRRGKNMSTFLRLASGGQTQSLQLRPDLTDAQIRRGLEDYVLGSGDDPSAMTDAQLAQAVLFYNAKHMEEVVYQVRREKKRQQRQAARISEEVADEAAAHFEATFVPEQP